MLPSLKCIRELLIWLILPQKALQWYGLDTLYHPSSKMEINDSRLGINRTDSRIRVCDLFCELDFSYMFVLSNFCWRKYLRNEVKNIFFKETMYLCRTKKRAGFTKLWTKATCNVTSWDIDCLACNRYLQFVSWKRFIQSLYLSILFW